MRNSRDDGNNSGRTINGYGRNFDDQQRMNGNGRDDYNYDTLGDTDRPGRGNGGAYQNHGGSNDGRDRAAYAGERNGNDQRFDSSNYSNRAYDQNRYFADDRGGYGLNNSWQDDSRSYNGWGASGTGGQGDYRGVGGSDNQRAMYPQRNDNTNYGDGRDGYGAYGNDREYRTQGDQGDQGNRQRWQGQGQSQGRHPDPDYHQWRTEQLQSLDNDYDNWRQERYKKFSSEFDEWRQSRNTDRSAGNAGTGNNTGSAGKSGNGNSADTGLRDKTFGIDKSHSGGIPSDANSTNASNGSNAVDNPTGSKQH